MSLDRNGYTEDNDMDVDGFSQTRSSSLAGHIIYEAISTSESKPCVDLCISALSILPAIQSDEGRGTRDKELVQILNDCPGHVFPLILPITLNQMKAKALSVTPETISEIIFVLGELRASYFYGRSEAVQYLMIDVLDASMDLWLPPTVDSELKHLICKALERLNDDVDEGRIQSWKCRDRFVQFFDHYFRADRVQESWAWDIIQKRLTEFLYPRLGDVDIRVRFRAATVVPRLFTIEGFAHRNPLELYAEMRQDLTSDLNEYDVISWFFFLILTLWIDMRRC